VLNIGGGEVLVIMLLALIVLGPQRLPDAARQIGKAMGEMRRLSSGFQSELRSALDVPVEAEARKRGAVHQPAPAPASAPALAPVETQADEVEPDPTSTDPTATPAQPVKRATAKRPATAKKRAAPLRANGKPSGRSAP